MTPRPGADLGGFGVFWTVMLWRMEELGDALKCHHQLEDFASVTLPAQVMSPHFSVTL